MTKTTHFNLLDIPKLYFKYIIKGKVYSLLTMKIYTGLLKKTSNPSLISQTKLFSTTSCLCTASQLLEKSRCFALHAGFGNRIHLRTLLFTKTEIVLYFV